VSKSHPKVASSGGSSANPLVQPKIRGTSFFVDHHLLWFSILKAFLKILHRVQLKRTAQATGVNRVVRSTTATITATSDRPKFQCLPPWQ